jgi:hypothetical protein
MKALERWSSVGVLGLAFAACAGAVTTQRTTATDSGVEGGSRGRGSSSGSGELDATLTEWDGWSEASVSEASGPPPTCSSPALVCGVPFPGATPFASSQDAANALVGRWSFCGADSSGFYPTYQLGEEYAADGTYYELIGGSGGQLLRNLDPVSIGNWEIDLAPNNAIEVHTFGGGTQRGGGLSACPPSLVLLGVEARLP